MIFSAAHCQLALHAVMRLLFVLLLHLSAVDWWRPRERGMRGMSIIQHIFSIMSQCKRMCAIGWTCSWIRKGHIMLSCGTHFFVPVTIVFKCSSTARCWRSVSFREACVAVGSRARSCVAWLCENINGFPRLSSEQVRTTDSFSICLKTHGVLSRWNEAWKASITQRCMGPSCWSPTACRSLRRNLGVLWCSMRLPPISYSFQSFPIIWSHLPLERSPNFWTRIKAANSGNGIRLLLMGGIGVDPFVNTTQLGS